VTIRENVNQILSELPQGVELVAAAKTRSPQEIQEAIEAGVLSPARFESYRRLQRELRHQAAREQYSANQEEKLRWKKIAQLQKRLKKDREVDM